MASTNQYIKLFNRYFILVWLVSFFLNICQNVLNSTIPLYLTSINVSTSFAGFLGLPYAFCGILIRFIGGHWVDNRSRRSLLAFGCFGFGLSALFFGIIPSAISMVLMRAIHGLCFASGQLAGSTASADVTPDDQFTRGVGIYWIASALSFGLSGYIVTGLSKNGFLPVFFACALATVVAGFLALFCNYEKKWPRESTAAKDEISSETNKKRLLNYIEPAAAKPAILMFLMAIGNASASMYLLLFGETMAYRNTGMVMIVAAIGMAIGNLISGPLRDKTGTLISLLVAFLSGAFGFALMALVHTEITFYLGGFAFGFIQGILSPVLYALAVEKVPLHRRGASGGTIFFTLDLGIGFGSFLWGIVIEIGGFTSTFITVSIIFAVAAIFSVCFYGGISKESK